MRVAKNYGPVKKKSQPEPPKCARSKREAEHQAANSKFKNLPVVPLEIVMVWKVLSRNIFEFWGEKH